MHEVSIAQGMLDLAIDSCQKQGYEGIESIRVKIGKASGVVPDSLLFAFEALKPGTIAEKAVLTIVEVPVSGFCDTCNKDFTVDEKYVISCPLCGGKSFRVETGRELNIDELEVF
jgi:hydrogenase nickel incorporation protein HypA/HybF